MWTLIFPEDVEFLLLCFRIHVGEGALSISHYGSDGLSQEVNGSPLSLFHPEVPMNCDEERSMGTVTSSEGNHLNSLFDWSLLAALPLAVGGSV